MSPPSMTMSRSNLLLPWWIPFLLVVWGGGLGVRPAIAGDEPASLERLPDEAFTRARAAHLLRRAGFGGTPEEIDRLHALGLDGAVDHLVNYERIGNPGMPPFEPRVRGRPGREAVMGKSAEERREIANEWRRADRRQLEDLREWWLHLMIQTPRPLEERMTLFWHGHFTSAYRSVRSSYHLYLQNTTLRGQATGSFRSLLHEMSRDPAMLRYLDGDRNRKKKPNENFAREVMELFTLGVGHYTEKDIREAARAFTGWTVRENRFVFDQRQHDEDEKTFLGRSGDFDGHDVIEIILEQDQVSRHIARKLFVYFAHPNPDAAVVEGLAQVMREKDYQLKPVLEKLFRSRAFHAEPSVGTGVRSPVDYLTGLFRSLDADPPKRMRLSRLTALLGQSLFDPPNVKGWEGGGSWITTSHLLNRYNLAVAIVGTEQDRRSMGRSLVEQGRIRATNRGRMGGTSATEDEMGAEMGMGREDDEDAPERGGGLARPFERRRSRAEDRVIYDARQDLRRRGLRTAAEVLDHYTSRLLAVPVNAETRRLLLEYLGGDDGGFDPTTTAGGDHVHGLLRLIVSMPEHQLK